MTRDSATAPFDTAVSAVVLPGTGSDARFAHDAFAVPLQGRGIATVAVEPDPRGVVASYSEAMDRAALDGPILVGGVSIGAAVALQWAALHPELTVGVLAALPAWTGGPDDSPAAASARWTASQLRAHGLESVTAAMVESSPSWLGATLSRSWRSQWPDLPEALEEAAGYRALDLTELRSVTVPVGVTAAVDDAVHPLGVGRGWVTALPFASLTTVTLDDIGADPSVLGEGCMGALDLATRAKRAIASR
ncbi:alpha/beta hydrolase [Rhodococcus artemisiae]|uniref:Alpha/beta hydrolase n=1 Tax=Rhodococcus artemisiae TaxID=714159 RepID=A0ABU7L4V5_9NOCA|nr:alpha/beta hydrolase [Rhodococcus artemisiae]MEE2056324.1 alpha/beta hydrolase [Rhodococcus artemisiae]